MVKVSDVKSRSSIKFLPLPGEMSVIYLFTRYKFNWSEVEFSFFSTYAMLTSLVGTLLNGSK